MVDDAEMSGAMLASKLLARRTVEVEGRSEEAHDAKATRRGPIGNEAALYSAEAAARSPR
jgi:hypothetical protein